MACSEGKYSIVSGVSSCLTCPPASYLSNATLGRCTVCPAGTYNAQDGMTFCRSCLPGTYSAANQTTCTACPLGSATDATGRANNCTACAPGTYAGVTGLSACVQCPAGTYANVSGASACLACGPGNFSSVNGSVECTQCPIGTRSNLTTRSTSCTACAEGTYASGTGWSRCQTCAAECVLGKLYAEVNCTAATNRVCSPCRRNPGCAQGQTSNVTWCPADGWFRCMPCPSLGNDYVHLHPEYSCLTCQPRNCGLTPGTYQASVCPPKGVYLLNDTYTCGRCQVGAVHGLFCIFFLDLLMIVSEQGCTYRQHVVSWSFCDGTGAEAFPLDPEFDQHCAHCNTTCRPGQYLTNLCTGRTMHNTETCANCTSCAFGFYHAKRLAGRTYPRFEGEPWATGYDEPACDGRGILNSDGATDCERCDACANGKYASDVRRCTGNGIWKDNFTCTDCRPCPSGYEHTVPCDGLSFNDSCKVGVSLSINQGIVCTHC